MNPWLKTSILAVALSGVLCSIPFMLGGRGDAHMGNWIPVMAAGVCAAALLPSLLVSWLWHRYLSKKKSFMAAGAIAAVLTFAPFACISNPMLGGWFWIIRPGIGLFPLVFCGVPLIYFLVCRKNADPVGTDNDRAAPGRV